MLLSSAHPYDTRSKEEMLDAIDNSEADQSLLNAIESSCEPDFTKMPNDVSNLAINFIKRCLIVDP